MRNSEAAVREWVLYRGRLGRLHAALHRHRYVLAPLSFAAGVVSFALVQRREGIAQWLALLLLATWLLGVVEVALPRRLRVPPGLLRFITQQAHQEAFFFTLPFLLRTTSWYTAQAAFTGTVIVAALCSMWDPLYFGWIAVRRWLYVAFHALAVYLVMLVALPLLLQLTTTQTLALAALAVGVLTAPGLAHAIDRERATHWLLLFAATAGLALLAWWLRPIVPPAILWVGDAAATLSIDTARREPGAIVATIDRKTLIQNGGLYAFTAIRAPRGLHEQVYHRWLHRGREEARVPLEIVGGRAEGYRAWSHKTGFPADALGGWSVQVVSDSGQLLGEVRFEIVETSEPQPMEPPVAPGERGGAGDRGPEAGAEHEPGVEGGVAAPDEPQPGAQRDQGPQGEPVNPGEVPGAQGLDEERRSGDEIHDRAQDAAAPPVPERAFNRDELPDAEPDRDRGSGEVQPDDGGNGAQEQEPPE